MTTDIPMISGEPINPNWTYQLNSGGGRYTGQQLLNSDISKLDYSQWCIVSRDNFDSGKKFDYGKPDWSLVPADELEEIVKVFTMGKAKYGRENWKTLEDGMLRSYAALMRHMRKYKKYMETGNEQYLYDEESGLHHLAHVATNALFMMWWDNNNNHKFSSDGVPAWFEQKIRELLESENIDHDGLEREEN